MEAGSLDGDSGADVRGCHGFGSILWEKVRRDIKTRLRRDYTGGVVIKGVCNLGTSILMTEPGGLQAWRLAAWMVILHPAAGRHGGWQLGW